MSLTIGLLVISCGRPGYLATTLDSAARNLPGINGPKLIVDDSGSTEMQKMLRTLDGYDTAFHTENRGLSAAIQTGWDLLDDCDYIFHLEDDFTFPRAVDVKSIAKRLDAIPELAQLALVRQPWSPEEHAAGGIIHLDPDAYVPREGYEEHVKLFTLNPCVYPRWVTELGWPEGGGEREFTDRLLGKYPEATFGYVGTRWDPPRCIHIGQESALFGGGRL